LVATFGCVWIALQIGCETLSTTAGAPSSGPVDGLLFYYLPRGKVTIRGSAPIISSAETDNSKQKNSKQKDSKQEASPEPTGLLSTEANAGRFAAGQAGGDQKAPATGGDSPPSGISGGDVTVNVTAEVEADEGAGAYYVHPRANYMYDDEVKVSVKKHLLSTGNVTTEDKTADIIGAIASTAKTGWLLARTASGEPTPPPAFTFSFHPSNASEVGFVVGELKRRGIILSVTANGETVTKRSAVHDPSDAELNDMKVRAELFTKEGSPGLLFRPAAVYNISLVSSSKKSLGQEIKVTQQFVLPDPTRLYVMRYDRMAFVKKVRQVGFTDGMLTDFDQKAPSPILGFLGIPKAILQALVPIPAVGPSGSASSSGMSAPKS